jgi:hypothetical protein
MADIGNSENHGSEPVYFENKVLKISTFDSKEGT